MYSGDEFYDDETTSGPIDPIPPRARIPHYEHVQKPRVPNHEPRPASLVPTVCRQCGRPIRRIDR